MKKTPTEEQPSDAWAQALFAFDRDLRRRGAAEKTRRAYAIDLGQFARWAGGRGLGPEAVGTRDLRRYAAALSEHGGAPSTVARKIASLRSFYRSLVEHGRVQQDPGGARRRARAERPARVCRARTPGTQPDPVGRRSDERRGAGAVSLQVRAAALHLRRAPPTARMGPPRRHAGRGLTALVASLLRHSPSGGRGRFAGDSGAFGTRIALDDAGLHSSRVRQTAERVLPLSPAGVRRGQAGLEA